MGNIPIHRVVIGTAGHVDHGKTALVKLFTGIDADRLTEEKKRQLTIDLGFANFHLPDGRRVGIIDVPGHHNYLKNMIAGAAGIDLVIFVIAADEGVMPQTRTHLDVCSLMGVKHGFVVLTKTDLVDAELLELAHADAEDFTKGTFLEGKLIIPVSTRTGIGLPAFLDALNESLLEVMPRPDTGIFRMYVQRVFSKQGIGTIVTGIPDFGRLRINDTVSILPGGKDGRVRGIQAYFRDVPEAAAGHSTAIAIAGLKIQDVRRGDAVVLGGTHEAASGFTARFEVLKRFLRSIAHNEFGTVYLGTREFPARIRLLMGNHAEPGEQALAYVIADESVPVFPGDRFIFRLPAPLDIVGGGTIIAPENRRLRRNPTTLRQVLEAESCLNEPEKMICLAIRDEQLQGITMVWAAARANLLKSEGKQLIETLSARGEVVIVGKLCFMQKDFNAWRESVVEAVYHFHAEHPWKKGCNIDELKSIVKLPKRTLGAVLSVCLKKSELAKDGNMIRLPEHSPSIPKEYSSLVPRVEKALLEDFYAPPVRSNLMKLFPGNELEAARVLEYLENIGQIMIYEGRFLFHAELLQKAWSILKEIAAENQMVKKYQFKERTEMRWRSMTGIFSLFREIGILRERKDYDEFLPEVSRPWQVEQ